MHLIGKSIIDIYKTIEFNFKAYVWALCFPKFNSLYSVCYYYWTGISLDTRNDSVSNQIQALFCYEKRSSQSTNFNSSGRERKITTKRCLLLHKISHLDIFVLVIEQIVCENSNWDFENRLPIVHV